MLAPAGATPFSAADGRGLNPLLRHPGMIIHPPMLYLGFVSFVIPFAFAIAALVDGAHRRSLDAHHPPLDAGRLAVPVLGLVLGARWAYDVLGWGGYWGWDPVEIAALMPWLTGTAFLHSVMIQEKRGMFKRLEYDPDHPDLFAGHLRHLPHPFGCAFFSARLRAKSRSARCS